MSTPGRYAQPQPRRGHLAPRTHYPAPLHPQPPYTSASGSSRPPRCKSNGCRRVLVQREELASGRCDQCHMPPLPFTIRSSAYSERAEPSTTATDTPSIGSTSFTRIPSSSYRQPPPHPQVSYSSRPLGPFYPQGSIRRDGFNTPPPEQPYSELLRQVDYTTRNVGGFSSASFSSLDPHDMSAFDTITTSPVPGYHDPYMIEASGSGSGSGQYSNGSSWTRRS